MSELCHPLGIACGFATWRCSRVRHLISFCVDRAECAVDDGSRPVPVKEPCIIPFNFTSDNIELFDIALERGDVNITITDTPEDLIYVDIHHIAKSEAAIPGLESTAVQEDGVIKIRTEWNDTFTEDMEGAPVNTLNCFRAVVTVQIPPDMGYLRPSLKVNITAKPMDCSFWNPSGCEMWPLLSFLLNLPDPYILGYGTVQVFSQPYRGRLPTGKTIGFEWTSMEILTTSGDVSLYDVELYAAPEASIDIQVTDGDVELSGAVYGTENRPTFGSC